MSAIKINKFAFFENDRIPKTRNKKCASNISNLELALFSLEYN